LAEVFSKRFRRIKVGDHASLTVDSYPGRTFEGRVNFIYPQVDMTTRTARARLVFSNPGLKLAPGMFVNVTLKNRDGKQLVIPATGVLQSGTRQIVFVSREDGYIEPREVQLGSRAERLHCFERSENGRENRNVCQLPDRLGKPAPGGTRDIVPRRPAQARQER